MSDLPNDPAEILAEAAAWYYEVAELYEDEDLDPDDHAEVLRVAFTESDCVDFAHILARMTGWPCVRMTYVIPDCGIGHHVVVRSPEGRLLDARGWCDETALVARYLGRGARRKGVQVTFSACESSLDSVSEEDDLRRVANGIRVLPWAPFDAPEFREMSRGHLDGIDPEPPEPR